MPPKSTTPSRRASSAGPTPQRTARRTPTRQIRTPGAVQQSGGPVSRTNVLTPYGRAAVREVEARRAALTPGRDRRKSGRQQRETPRHDLRALSRLLKPKTQPYVPTPPTKLGAQQERFREAEFDDDGPDPERPRLSIAIDEESDEDDSLLLPPRSAGLDNDEFTGRSVELPRRAVSELPISRYRGSFGDIRMSDQLENFNENGLGAVFDSSFAIGGPFDQDQADMDNDLPREDTGSLRNVGLERTRISDIRPQVLDGDDNDNTFFFTIPPPDLPSFQDPSDASESYISHPDLDNNSFNLETAIAAAEGESRTGIANVETDEEQEDADEPVNSDDDEGASVLSSSRKSPDPNMSNMSLPDGDTTVLQASQLTNAKKKTRVSKHGIPYKLLPVGVVKKLAATYARTGGSSKSKLSKETLDAIMQASDWFFEQVSEDLGAYAKHAGRKTIEESDVTTLMKRQRQTNATTTPFSLAQRHLPRELLQELRMIPPPQIKTRKSRVRHDNEED